MKKNKKGYKILKDTNRNTKGISIETDPKKVKDPVDKIFADIFSRF